MKRFLKIFTLLFIGEILLGMGAVFLQQGVYNKIANITGNIIMAIISFPASLADRSYPYYSPDPWYITIPVVIINIVVHTFVIIIINNWKKKEKIN
ncbi:hypothetical protein [Flavobacterium rhizosphaerae]|uniref:Uncharacterized protein n=1 Tax=Flavobacterium rhizosphaerae TaxID=3163298 RepID=A0ABW8YT08_9FLAO